VGDPMEQLPPDGTILRVLSINNKLKIEKEGTDSCRGLQKLHDNQVGVFGYSETNANWKMGKVRENFKEAMARVWDHSRMQTSTSSWKCESIGKHGGTVMAATGRWTSRVHLAGDDPWGMGRFSYIGLGGSNKMKLLIITFYRVGKQTVKTAGPKTVFQQEWHILREKGFDDPNPREQLIDDMISFIATNQEAGYEILLMGDANENMRGLTAKRGIGRLIQACQLRDLHFHHPHTATHVNGSDPIDCMLGSAKLTDFVQGSGYNAFYETHYTDHRALYVDIDIMGFFGSMHQDPTRPEARLLRSTHPKEVRRYNAFVKEALGDIPSQFQDILATASTWEEAKAKFDRQDRRLDSIMRRAEQQSCRSKSGKAAEWSTTLKAASLLVDYWKAKKRNSKRNQNLLQAKLTRIRQEIETIEPMEDNGSSDKKYIATQLRKALSYRRAARRDDAQNREAFLEEEIRHAKADGNTRRVKRLTGIANAERQKRSHSRIRRALGTRKNGGVTSLRVREQIMGEDTIVEIIDPEEIQERLIERNRQHFKQAHETPFYDPQLFQRINDAADNALSDAILDGSPVAVSHEAFPEVAEFVKMMARPTPIQEDEDRISHEITREDVSQGFAKWRESTSTSPSGRHLGHYKAWIQDDDLLDLLTTMLQIVVKFGFAPERWCHSLNVMLEKDKGNPMIERLRIIHLFEADFNWMLKQFWAKRMLHYGESQGVLGEEQHGSRKNRMAIDAVMLKLLTYELSRLYKSDLVTMDNDAKSCYDRIIISLAMLASRRLGMPVTVARAHAATLRNMLHKIRTSHGISSATYSALVDELCGIGQGSGAGPALWVAISIVLIECYKNKVDGMNFTDPAELEHIERWLDGFVDDTELGMNDFWEEHEDLASLVDTFQAAAQRWERLLFTSGGALELSKCSWYCLHWQWDTQGVATATTFGDSGPTLNLTRGSSSTSHPIKRLEVHEAHKTLGVRLEPLSVFDTEYDHLIRKSNAHAIRLEGSSLGSYDSLTFYRSTFMSSVGYSFSVIPLSFDASRRIQSKIIATVLNKISFNRHFPRAVVYGPVEMGGLGLQQVYVEQGMAKISMFLRHTSSDSELGKLLRIILRVQQLEAGVGWDILENPSAPLEYLSPTWITALRDFIGLHDIKIKLCEQSKWSQYRSTGRNDTFIMDEIRKLKRYNQGEMIVINRVRIFFQALTISDITDSTGRKIDDGNWHVSSHRKPWRTSSWRWPKQPVITEAQVRLWREAITIAYLDRFGNLLSPLGRWTCITHQRHRSYIAPLKNKLLIRKDDEEEQGSFHLHENTGQQDTYGKEAVGIITNEEAQSWLIIPAETIEGNNVITSQQRGYELPVSRHRISPISFSDYVASQSSPIRRLLADLQWAEDAIATIRITWDNDGVLHTATDGSAPEDGTFGWVVADRQGTSLVECSGPVDGAPDQVSSGRAESTGILSLGFFFQLLAKYFSRWPGGQCINVTDSTTALRRARRVSGKTRVLRSRLTSDMDCMTAYRHLGRGIYEYIAHDWVKGHQGDHVPVEFLSMAARMNTRADELAEQYRVKHHRIKGAVSLPCADPIPGQQVQLIINGFAITQHHARWIRYQINGYNLRDYLQGRHKWRNSTWDYIDWYGFKSAIFQQTPTMRRRISKFVHGWWNTGVQRRKFNKRDFILCPRCMKFRETTDHVLYCSHRSEETQAFRNELFVKIRSTTTGSLCEVFESAIRQLTRDPDLRPRFNIKESLPREVKDHLKQAIKEQHAIGWNLLFRGYMAQGWTRVYAKMSGNGHGTKQTKKWSAQIIKGFWTYAFQMWNLRCATLNENESALKYTKIDNEIRAMYASKEQFLLHDQPLFHLPLAQVLAQSTSCKEARLIGLHAAQRRWRDSFNLEEEENSVHPTNHRRHQNTKHKQRK